MNEFAEMMLRLVLAGVLGGLIGAEREYRGKVAGTRTHLLVALGSALMLLVSQHSGGGRTLCAGRRNSSKLQLQLKTPTRDSQGICKALRKLHFRLDNCWILANRVKS
jgi:uncharacterized membrane protein YhiD involved in acid resistance